MTIERLLASQKQLEFLHNRSVTWVPAHRDAINNTPLCRTQQAMTGRSRMNISYRSISRGILLSFSPFSCTQSKMKARSPSLSNHPRRLKVRVPSYHCERDPDDLLYLAVKGHAVGHSGHMRPRPVRKIKIFHPLTQPRSHPPMFSSPPLFHLRGSSKLISWKYALRSSDIIDGRKRDDENLPSSIIVFSGGVCVPPRADEKNGVRYPREFASALEPPPTTTGTPLRR